MSHALPPARRAPAGRAQHVRRRRLVVFCALLAVVLVGVLTAVFTLPHWYRPWMPSSVGQLGFPLRHVADVRAAAERNHLDPALVAAVIYVESRFDDSVESRSGAVGLMQVLPSTAEEIARKSGGSAFVPSDLNTPRVNILYGCFYLRRLLDSYHGSLVEALAAYNAGEAHVSEWLRAAGGTLTITGIPYPETRLYVQKVLAVRTIYRHIYGAQLGSG